MDDCTVNMSCHLFQYSKVEASTTEGSQGPPCLNPALLITIKYAHVIGPNHVKWPLATGPILYINVKNLAV